MTRLIDADVFQQEADNEDKNGVLTFRDVALWIEEQPTVEAIPIWWIEAKKSKMIRGGDRELTLRWLLQDWQLETRR